ncbi:Cyclic nucleotide-gated olfactory channel [Echinococcus granulosus]|nr:Cyclic nucleotide-gated olfactory channel [Echinococcus granulosus]
MPSHPVQTSQCIPSLGANTALSTFKETSSCLRLNVSLPRRSSSDTNSDINLSGGGNVGSADSRNGSMSARLRPAMSDHRLMDAHQDAEGVRWHSYSGAPPRSLFDEEVKHSSPSGLKTGHQVDSSRNISGEEGVGLLTSMEKASKSVCILAPDGSCIFFWSWVVCVACLYNMWIIPFRFAFAEVTSATASVWFTLDYTADGLYLLDLLLGFRIAYLENGILQKDPRKSRQHYLNSMRFYLNCLCILPLDLLYISVGVVSLLRILRFVKIYKLFESIDMAQRRTVHPNFFRTFGWIIITLTGLHWNACFYQCAMRSLGFHYNSTGDVLETYVHSVYDSLLCLTLQKEPQLKETTNAWQLYALLIFEGLTGIAIITSLIANVNMLVANARVNENEFRRQLAEVRMYLVRRKAPETLKRRVVCWFDYLWRQSHIPDEQRVFKHLPDRLKAEVAIHVHLDMLKRVDMFQDTEEGFLLDLVLRLRPALFSPGDFICRKGEIGREMFFVSQGKLDVLAADEATILATLGPGSYFGEISILNMGNVGNRRTASVRSIGYSDLFCLSKEDLWNVLNDYPSAKRKLEKVAFDRLSSRRSPIQSGENCEVELHRRPQRSVSSASSVSRRSPFPLTLPLQLPPPLPPSSRLGLKRRRSALSMNSSYLPCNSHAVCDRHTSLDRSCSTRTAPILHRQFSLQCNYGETVEPVTQTQRRTITSAVLRSIHNPGEEVPTTSIFLPTEATNNPIPQIRFERAATPVGRPNLESDLKQLPVEFSIPEDIQGEEQSQTRLQLPEATNHLFNASTSTSASGSGCGSTSASPSLAHSAQLNLLLELQQRVASLESENRVLSMCLRQAVGPSEASDRPTV